MALESIGVQIGGRRLVGSSPPTYAMAVVRCQLEGKRARQLDVSADS